MWFDALLGYITALLEEGDAPDLNIAISRGWPASVHVIGKDILRFHAVYWPAMLLSAGLELPAKVFGHGFLTREGQKMGKSLGNVLDPAQLLDRCGRDAVRWYLLRDIPFGDDGDFQQQRFSDLVNNDLANTIGNMLNRTSSMARRWFDACVPPATTASGNAHPLALAAAAARHTVLTSLEQLDFRSAAEASLQLAIAANGFLNEQAPWSRMKQEGTRPQVGNDLYAVLEAARITALLMAPLLPDLSERMLVQLGQSVPDSGAHAQPDGFWLERLEWGVLQSGASLPEPSPVMARLELSEPL